MADVSRFELSMDLSGVLADASKLDKKLVDLVEHSRQLQNVFDRIKNMSFSHAVNMGIFDNIIAQMKKIGETKVTPDFDADNANNLYSVMDKIIKSMETLSFTTKLFDTQNLYDTSESLFSIENKLKDINAEINKARKEYNQPFDEFVYPEFEPPVNPKTQKEYGKKSTAYQEAKAEYEAKRKLDEEEFNHSQALMARERQLEAEYRLRGLINEKAALKKKLAWVSKTEDEWAQLAQRRIAAKAKAEQEHINEIRKEYKKITADEVDLMRKSDNLRKADIGIEATTAASEYERQMTERDARRKELERNYGEFLVDIAEDAQRRILDIETRRIKERIAAEAKAEREEWQQMLSTPEGALDFASSAKTISEMKEAQKYLITARDTADVSDTATIDALNKKYQELRITIEELSTAEKNENSLQPKVRTEYARLLKELDKVKEARERMSETSAFQTNDKDAQAAYGALVTREIDIQRRITEIRQTAQGQLTDVERRHEAERAQIALTEMEKVEARRAELARKRFKEELEQNSKYGTISTDSANRLIGVTDNASNVQQEELAIQKLRDAIQHLDKSSSDYDATVEKLNRRIKEHEHNIKMATDAQYRENEAKRQADAQNTTFQGALNYSKNTKSINEQIQAIKYLKEARAKLEKGDNEALYLSQVRRLTAEIQRQQAEVDRLTGRIRNAANTTKKSANEMKGAFNSIRNTIATTFSINTIKNYISKLVSIRGEFEMQQRSLQVLLRDVDKADELWNKTVQLAVKSPLTTSQLVKYTKQLAAYRIETEKLYDTNRMLADVSQGLGVDMQRLILAFGQVKAAAFLRGTELRQFNEAGVNMLDELAKRFTALEGKAVSIGDVFDRVSKRMVSFKDVEAVFETITSQGGMFYQMQEKQSETLKGQILNLKDSYELMLNDIGISWEGFMKSVVSTMRDAINQWRTFAPMVSALAAAIVTHLVGKGLAKLIGYLKLARLGMISLIRLFTRGTQALKVFARMNRIASLSSPWTALAAVISAIVVGVITLTNNTSKLNAELERIDMDLTRRLYESKEAYIQLATAATDTTKSIREQNKALVRLKTTFGEMLPDDLLKIDYLKKQTDGYKKATDAITLYYEALSIESKKSKISEKYNEEIETQVTDLKEDFKDAINNANLSIATKRVLTANLSAIIHQTLDDVRNGKIGDDISSLNTAILEKMALVTGVDSKELQESMSITGSAIEWAGVQKNINELSNALKEYKSEISEVEGLTKELVPASQVKGLESAKKEVESMSAQFNKLHKSIAMVASGEQTFANIQKEISTYNFVAPIGKTEEFTKALNTARQSMIAAANNGQVAFAEAMPKIEKRFTDTIAALVTGANEGNTAVQNLAETIRKGANDKALPQWANLAFQAMRKIQEVDNVDLDIFKTVIPQAEQSLSDYRQIVKSQLEQYENTLKQYKASISQQWLTIFGVSILEELGFGSKEELEKAIKALKELYTAVGNFDKSTNRSSKKTDDTLKRRVQLIKDMRKAYEDLNKTWGETESRQRVIDSFMEEWNTLMKGTGQKIEAFNVTTIEDYIDSLKKLEQYVKKDKNAFKEWQKAVREAQLELDKTSVDKAMERMKRSIEQMFSGYELGIELDKIHVPRELASELFGAKLFDFESLQSGLNADVFKGLLSDVKTMMEYEKKFSEEELKNFSYYQSIKENVTKQFSQDQIKLAQETNQKLEDIEMQSLEDRLKKYAKYFEKGLSDLGKIQVDALNQIVDVEKTYNDALKKLMEDTDKTRDEVLATEAGKQLTDWRDLAFGGINKERQEKYEKEQWEIFQKSPMYEKLFGDIEHYGSKAVDVLLTRLNELKNSLTHLPPETYKAIQNSINKLNEQQIELDPWGKFFEYSKEVSKLNKKTYIGRFDGKEYKGQSGYAMQLSDLEAQNAKLYEQLATIDAIQRGEQDINSLKHIGIDLNDEMLSGLTDTARLVLERMRIENEINNNNQQASDALENYNRLVASGEAVINNAKKWGEAINKVISSVDELLDAFGLAEDSSARIWLNFSAGVVDAVVQAIALAVQMKILQAQATLLGVSMNSALGIIGWVATALQVVASLLASIFQANDKRLEKQIEKLKEKTEALQKSWEKLNETIEVAHDVGSLTRDLADANRNIEQQIQNYNKMISLEKQKKSSDDDKIKEYQEAINELREQQEELEKETMESFGATYDVRSATREFVDAWYDAFKETGNGLEGLQDNFRDFFANVIAEQAVIQGAGQIMQPLFDEINKSLEDDYTITEQEYANIDEKQREQLQYLDEFLTGFYERFGDIIENNETLSGLQKGIQGITEEQADIIAAYLSSIRFYIAQDSQNLSRLTEMLAASNTAENPMLSQLKIIAAQTTAINSLLEGVTKGGHSQGGRGIKVFLN